MASRLLDRLKRSLFKDVQGAGAEQEERGKQEGEEFLRDGWEAELEEEEEERVRDRLGGTLCFDSVGRGAVDGMEGEGSGLDSDSDFLGESTEEGLSSTDTSPMGMSPFSPSPSSLPTRQLQESWRSLRGGGAGKRGHAPSNRGQTDSLLFEVTAASVNQDGSSKHVMYTLHVIQAGGSDKTPAVITRRYSDFQRLHAALHRSHGDQMERICFPRKKLHGNFTAETIAKRSRAFEQYLSHLCSLSGLRGLPCVRRFFYVTDLQTGQLLIRVGQYQEALGPLLNAKRLQHKLGWASYHDNQALTSTSSHWFFTVVGLLCCFQEVDQLEEAWDHCGNALHVLTPPTHSQTHNATEDKPHPTGDKHHPLSQTDAPLPRSNRPHPLLVPLLRAMVRLSWQTRRDKWQWEELLQQLQEQWTDLDNQLSIKEFLVKHNLQESEGEG
ncbi:hypothetical protein LDENG_00180690 [Lucifuga dentata]|nr:hypothetical protein LDENG_00180690 [Lucifuga dentata]